MIAAARFVGRAVARAGRRFGLDTSGNVAIIFVVASSVMLLATGAGVDLARAYFARQKLSQVATMTCQYATRPSAVNTGANAYYVAGVNTFASNALTTQNWPASDLPTGGPNGTSSTYFTATGAGASNNTQEPTGTAELWYKMPTTFMKMFAVNQITVHAVMSCQPPAQPPAPTQGLLPPAQSGMLLVNEGFETGKPSYYFTNPSGQTGTSSTPQNTFPLTAGYQGDGGNQFYVMGYCLEIDQVGIINASTPQGTHSAELDCDNGNGSGGNSSISTKTYLTTGYYELRYFYRSRIDYPNYDPTYICGSTATDVSWANDTDGAVYGTRTNEINVYFDQSTGGAAPPLHTTMDGTQSLAGSNVIDVCLYGPSWLERSVKIKVTTAGYYWLSFAADGNNDSYGGQIDDIRLCVDHCTTPLQENFPTGWTTSSLLFQDSFGTAPDSAPTAPTNMSWGGNLAKSPGVLPTAVPPSTCLVAPTTATLGWPCQGATGWATAPYNQVNTYTQGGTSNSQYIAIDGAKNGTTESTTNRLISRPFLLVPGYYQVSYSYIPDVDFSNLDSPATVYCYAAPGSGSIYLSSYGNNSGTPRYASSKISTDYTTGIVGVFMSHGQLISTPNIGSVAASGLSAAPWAVFADTSYTAPALNGATSYTNPDKTVTTTPATGMAPDAVTWPSYNASVNNPVIDTCGYAPNYAAQARSVSVKITKSGVYWLTFSTNGGVADGYGGGIEDVKLTALGGPSMSGAPTSPLVAIPTPAPASDSVYTGPSGATFTGFHIVADPFLPPAADQ